MEHVRHTFVCRIGGILNRKRDNRVSYYAYRPTEVPKEVSSVSFFPFRPVSGRRETVCQLKSKRGVLQRDHVARGTSEAVTAGIRAVHARTPSLFLCPGTICYFVHIHNGVTSSAVPMHPLSPAFSSSLFPVSLSTCADTHTSCAGYCSSIPAPSLNSQEGF